MIKLQDFAAERGVTDRQIQRLLKKYETDLSGQFERRGQNGTWLTEAACEFLISKMISSSVVVGDAKQLREMQKLREENQQLLKDKVELLEKINELAQWQADHAVLIAGVEQNRLALEAAAKEKELLEGFIRDAKAEIEVLNEEKREEAARAHRAEDELQKIKSAGLWQRLKGWK